MKIVEKIWAIGTPKNVQLSARRASRPNRTTPYQMKNTASRSPVRRRRAYRRARNSSTSRPRKPDTDSYRNSGWKCCPSVAFGSEPAGQAYWTIRCEHWIAIPHGRFVGGPYNSWLKKFPQRAMACIVNRPGATMSAHIQKLAPRRRT